MRNPRCFRKWENKNKTTVITTNEKQTKTHETEKKVVAKTTEKQTEKRVKKWVAK